MFEEFEYFQEKDDDLYNDRSYLSSDDVGPEDSRTGMNTKLKQCK